MERAEKRLASRFDLCTATTHAEWETLEGYRTGVASDWFPNGVDSAYFAPTDDPYDADTIAFVGRMDYYPNQQCMFDFCANTLPLLRAKRPALKLLIVGADPSPAVLQLGRTSPNVTVTGSVPDVRPYLRKSALMVAPLNIARGTQNKILEAMALGRPRRHEPHRCGRRGRVAPRPFPRGRHTRRVCSRDRARSGRPGRAPAPFAERPRAHAFPSRVGPIDAATRWHHRALPLRPFSPGRVSAPRRRKEPLVDISIFGLGYVGAVSLACLARDGHRVVGVDVDQAKLDLIAAGRTPVVEEGMVQLMADVVAQRPRVGLPRCARRRAADGALPHLRGDAVGAQRQPGPDGDGATCAGSGRCHAREEGGARLRIPLDARARDGRRRAAPFARSRVREERRRRLPRLLPAGIPARGFVDPRLRQAAVIRSSAATASTARPSCVSSSGICRARSTRRRSALPR